MSNSIIYHVSCYRFVSQHTYIKHIGPHAHVDTDRDSRQHQQPPAPAPAVAQIIQNNTKSSHLYYVLHVIIVLCIVLCIMYSRSLTQTTHVPCWAPRRAATGLSAQLSSLEKSSLCLGAMELVAIGPTPPTLQHSNK
jgi:hypothetical protein